MEAKVYSITRAEIDEFWRRKEVEEEESRLAAEKAAARIKAKTLKIEDYMLFEQMIRKILNDGDRATRMERGVTNNSSRMVAASSSTEARIGIKHWWKRSTYAYLNEPEPTSMDEKGRSKHATITYVPQEFCCTRFCSSTPYQPNNTAFVIF
ncbi:uncharacterized protein LOC133889760 isoform X2 [Phragmites australis]|uniref:uncharacterized protein LOC133889760 isoform X2 n=1 Tax=Phragmites australis TaxID=29695 RepID=UPI002D78229A|nr:uncharacterized protein LOC133889760 isoform X2 [Phragmites australis]